MWYPVTFSYSCQGVRDAKVFYVFVDMAYKLVGKLSPFNVCRLVTRNSIMTLQHMINFLSPISSHSSLFINHSGPSSHCPFCILSIDSPRFPKSTRFLSVGQCLQTIPFLPCDLSNLLHSVGNENFPQFSGLQIQYGATMMHVHPHVHGSNGPPL